MRLHLLTERIAVGPNDILYGRARLWSWAANASVEMWLQYRPHPDGFSWLRARGAGDGWARFPELEAELQTIEENQ